MVKSSNEGGAWCIKGWWCCPSHHLALLACTAMLLKVESWGKRRAGGVISDEGRGNVRRGDPRHSNLCALLVSSTISPIASHNQQTNSVWTLQFPLAPRHGFSNKYMPISPSSGIQTVKFSPPINSRRQLRLSRHFSMALSALAFCPMLDGSRHMQRTQNAARSVTSFSTLVKSARKL